MSEQKNSAVNSPGNHSLTELLLESVMTHASEAIVLTNPSDEIIVWNKKAEELFGYQATEAIGKSITLILDVDSLSRLRTINDEPTVLTSCHRDGT